MASPDSFRKDFTHLPILLFQRNEGMAKPHTRNNKSSLNCCNAHSASAMGPKQTNHRGPKSTFVHCYSKGGQTRARLDCPLSAINRDRCTAANSSFIRSPRRRWRAPRGGSRCRALAPFEG